MNTYHQIASRRFPVVACAAVLIAASGPLHAAEITWNPAPNSGNWNHPANWDGGSVPAVGDSLFFDASTITALSNDFTAGRRFDGITFGELAPAFTVLGNDFLLGVPVTGSTASGGNLINNSLNLQTVGLGLTLATGNHAINGGTGGLALTGSITRSPGSVVAFTPGDGNITTTLANTNGILGGWATVGTNWATVNGSNQVIELGSYTDIATGGLIASDPTSNVRINSGDAGAVSLAAGGVTDINSLMQNVDSIAVTVNIGAGNTLRLGAQGGIFRTGTSTTSNALQITGGSLTAGPSGGGAGEIVLNAGGNTASSTAASTIVNITSALIDNPEGGAVTLVKTGRGYSTINNASNSFTGGTIINEGRLAIATATGSLGSGPVTVLSGGQLYFSSSAANYSNDFFISGTGPASEAGNGAIRARGTMSGMITLLGNAAIAGSNGVTTTFSGQITDGGNGYNLTLGATGNVGGTTNIIVLSNTANDWSGNTSIVARGTAVLNNTVRLGGSEVIPHGTGKGNVIIGNSTFSIAMLDLNGFNETINGLDFGSGTATNAIVQNGGAVPATLTLGAGGANGDFAGILQDGASPLAVTKIGAGTQVLSGANTYTGDTVISAGTLVLMDGNNLSDATNVHLTLGGMLTLTAGTEAVAGLFLDSVAQAPGTYGATGSGADHIDDMFFSGSGVLLVVPEPGTFAMLALAGGIAGFFHIRRRRQVSAEQ